jgi:hypothetical protein
MGGDDLAAPQFHPVEVELLLTEYNQLVEEIRESSKLAWLPWSAYLAATAAILSVLPVHDYLRFFGSLAMFALGILVVVNIYKLRRLNNFNYLRLWDIEARWQRVVGRGLVGARWNPIAADTLRERWGYRSHLLGVVDFGLILVTALIAAGWLTLSFFGSPDVQPLSSLWVLAFVFIEALAFVSVVAFWLCERGVDDRARTTWARKHEDLRQPPS